MKRGISMVAVLFLLAATAWAQPGKAQKAAQKRTTTMRYANMPTEATPYGRYRKPYKEWYVEPNTLGYDGAARSVPEPSLKTLKAVNVGFLGPITKGEPDEPYGTAMLHGAELAIQEANAKGGYRGKPFALKVYNDLPAWGASSMDIVKMYYQQHVWAMFGSVGSASTHIELRAALKLQLPIIDTATSDPTVTETRIQWLLHNFPDDRQQGYALADYIFNQLKLKRVGMLRVNARYGREGYKEFFRDALRMGYQPVVVVKYPPNMTDFSAPLRRIKQLHLDGLVLWGNAQQGGLILKQMRAMGMKLPVFGSSRMAYRQVIKIAGPAANGFVVTSAINPDRRSPKWLAFCRHYRERFHAEPGAYASYAFDGMNMLIGAIRKVGLNRARIMDALRGYEMKKYHGVSGTAFFDYTLNNIAPVTFAKVEKGRFVYWPEHRTDWKGNPYEAWR